MKKRNNRVSRKDYAKLALAMHKKFAGKLRITPKARLKTRDDWSTYYTPGVAAVSSYLAKHPKETSRYTIKRNTVAVVSDGSAVLGLGDIGPEGALPVMEGKCVIFKEMADIDAFPIVLDTKDPEAIIETVKRIASVFGGINLEDIKAPKCFAIEERLKRELNIPVMHDDQHGTAIVVLAGLINAAKVVKKDIKQMRVVVVGAGAAGRAIALILLHYGIKQVIVTDSQGIIHDRRPGLKEHKYKKELARMTNPERRTGLVHDAVEGADAVISVSGPGTVTKEHIARMGDKPIVFALANPTPEIMPEDAKEAGAYVIATGRSDYPNQVNNSLVFPGVFRGALDHGVRTITDEMKVKAAQKLAALVKHPTRGKIIPRVNTRGLVKAVASAIK